MERQHGTLAPRIGGGTSANDLHLANMGDVPLVAEESYDGLRITFAQEVDLEAAGCSFLDCEFANIRSAQADFDQAHLTHCLFEDCSFAHLSTVRAGLRECEFSNCRIGAMDVMDSALSTLVFRNCHVSYLNARMAVLKDVEFRDCVIDDLDCANARLTRLAFAGTVIRRLDFHHADLQDVDLRDARLQEIVGVEWLRNATMTVEQIADLAQAFASSLGIRTE